jgi:hypothetical protein
MFISSARGLDRDPWRTSGHRAWSKLAMATHELPELSRGDDSEAYRKWVPLVVPLCAVVLTVLVFLIAWEVLYRP